MLLVFKKTIGKVVRRMLHFLLKRHGITRPGAACKSSTRVRHAREQTAWSLGLLITEVPAILEN